MSEREMIPSSAEYFTMASANKATADDDGNDDDQQERHGRHHHQQHEGYSASLSLLPALSMFATTHPASVSRSNSASVVSSSAPHTPPSASPTASFALSANASFGSSGNSHGKVYPYRLPYSSGGGDGNGNGDPTSESPLRLVEMRDRDHDDDGEADIVLEYAPVASRLGADAQAAGAFAAQRPGILKINALTAPGLDSNRTLAALLHPSHHPRSLWTLASRTETEVEREGCEPFVWAIFDSHDRALSALSSISGLGATHPPMAEPALESDLYPFSKLRKVDMKAWTARVTLHSSSSSNAYSTTRSPSNGFRLEMYPPTHAYPYPPPTSTSTSNTYPPQNTYPPASHRQTDHNLLRNESNYEQEVNTPIPHPVPPQPQSQPQPHAKRTDPFDHPSVVNCGGQDDHSTPIPPSHAPVAPAAPATPAHPSEMNPAITEPRNGQEPRNIQGQESRDDRTRGSRDTYHYARRESREHHIDPDGGAGFHEISAERHVGIDAECQSGISAIGRATPHSPPVGAVPSRLPPVTATASSEVHSLLRTCLVPRGNGNSEIQDGDGPHGGLSHGFGGDSQDVDGDSRNVDRGAHLALNRLFFGTRDQGHPRASEREDQSTPAFHNVLEQRANTNTNANAQAQAQAHAQWNRDGGNSKEQSRSVLDRDLYEPRDESGFTPPSFGPSSSTFTCPSSSNPTSPLADFTTRAPRLDSIGRTGDVSVGANARLPQARGGPEDAECIEKTRRTATAGVHPSERPTPAEASFPPLPPRGDRGDYSAGDFGGYERHPPTDQSSSSSPLLDGRRAPDGDRIKPISTLASTAHRASSSTTGSTTVGSNQSGSVLMGHGSRSSPSLGRFSPMLDRPIQSQGVSEDEGCHYGGRVCDENSDEMLSGRAGPNCVGFEDANSFQSSAPQIQRQSSQPFHRSHLKTQSFLHEHPPPPPHPPASFLHQDPPQYQRPPYARQPPPQHQPQFTYPTTTATYAHTSLGVPPPTAFRHGDWLCEMPSCGVHNFGRNVACIMCGAERAASAAVGHGRVAAGTGGAGRMQSGGGMTLSMGMGMTEPDNELGGDYAHSGTGTGAHAVGIHHGASDTVSNQSYPLGQQSTYIPVIPRFAAQHQNIGAPQTRTGDIAMNSTLVQALGGIGQVAAIQEAIKAHRSQMQPHDGRGRSGGDFAGQRHVNNGGHDGTFSTPGQGGQLLIPTTLGNSPSASSPQDEIVVPQGRAGRFGEARNDDGRGRNLNPMIAGMQQQHQGLSSMPSQYSPQGLPMRQQQRHHLQHPLSPHPSISAGLLNAFSPASAAIAAAAIPAAKMPALLTPSGRKFATGGRVQNISRDELNPLLMFWPDNEPLPLTSQIRPPAAVLMALGGVQGPPPPILNTGNKGPIDAQPGDWTCGKCDYLNWRRRRVCANCFPHAEGNTEGTKHSTSDVQERVALLASVIYQQQQQVQAQQRQIQSQQARVAAFTSAPNDPISPSGGLFLPSNVGPELSSQQQAYTEAPRRGDTMPLSKMDSMSMQLLAQKYGYAVPPTSGLGSSNSMGSFGQPAHPLNLPPRMTQPSAPGDMMSRGCMDLNRNALGSQSIRADGTYHFDGLPQRLRSSPPSSRSSFSIGSSSSFYKSTHEPTPSPLPLLPAFLQEVVGETSESSSSSVHESPSPPSPSSTSSAFENTYSGDSRLGELVDARLRRGERSSPASGPPQISNNIHRTASHSSIWSFGYPGDRKEGIRPV